MTQLAAPAAPAAAISPREIKRREQILDAATKLFAEYGYADTDTQLLADRLRVGKGTLYRYFASKRDLFLAAADRGMRQLCQYIDDAIAPIQDPPERIAQVVRSYLTFFAEHPELCELLIHERALFKDRKKPTYMEYREANRERLRMLYRSYISEGQIRDMSVDRILDVLGDLLYGTMFTNYFSGRQRSVEEQTRDILDVVFHGILSDVGRSRRPPEPKDPIGVTT
ncbi:MAG: TetR family transcriptional regulator [Planctomycetia bacterium 21-64-5]|nr:MAG: TetR family transcriptional regulator [Planctomycetia bacterium 21-64-5]HQU41998.1 TetR/AcrR family transcriptional regulator [Pirellulales bacterium]HVA45367.1 TetR/AcrR family transcriptional regulator [Pirellulales bacterium]